MRPWLTMTIVLVLAWCRVRVTSRNRSRTRGLGRRATTGSSSKTWPGRTFIARPLKERYDVLRKRAASLRSEIDGARIDPAKARAEVSALQAELNDLLRTIDHAKLYIPGATVHKRTETTHVPIKPDDLLLVDCQDVEVRGWDGPDVQCVLEKTVLDDDSGKVADDFAGIELVARKGSGKEFFGFYLDVRDLPKFKDNLDLQGELGRFVFPEFLNREFPYITVKGLDYQEGNRQITVTVKSERGDGFSGSQWRRHATLTLLVPRCQRVGIRGALRAAQGPRPERRALGARPGEPRLHHRVPGDEPGRVASGRQHPDPVHRRREGKRHGHGHGLHGKQRRRVRTGWSDPPRL